MKECPKDANPANCGYEALKQTAGNHDIVILPEQEPSLVLEDSAKHVLEICSVREVRNESAWDSDEDLDKSGSRDVAEFGCLACGKCVLVIDDMEKLSVQLKQTGA